MHAIVCRTHFASDCIQMVSTVSRASGFGLSCHPPVYLSWTPDAIIYHHIVSCHLCFLFVVSFWRYNIDGNTLAKTSNFTFTFSFISYLTKAGSVIHTASVIGSWNHLQFRSSLLINGHTPLSLSRLILCCAEKKMME